MNTLGKKKKNKELSKTHKKTPMKLKPNKPTNFQNKQNNNNKILNS